MEDWVQPASRGELPRREVMQTPDEVAAMLRLKALGWGVRRIAAELGCSHMTVRRYLSAGGWIAYRGRGRPRTLSGLEEWVAERFRRHAGNADVVRQELEREKGIRLTLRTVEREVRHLRRELEAEARATIRFETPPGKQLQIDFGERRAMIGDENVKVYLFVATLGYSRRLYVRPFRNERQESWFAGVVGAFHHFGGITEEVDNDRGLVARHDRVICWAAAGCFGVRTLFIAAPWMYALIKAVGAVYLVFVGGQLLWNSWRNKGQFRSRLTEGLPRLSPFHLGLLTTLANPRSAVSVASIFATAMPSDPSLMLSVFVMLVM